MSIRFDMTTFACTTSAITVRGVVERPGRCVSGLGERPLADYATGTTLAGRLGREFPQETRGRRARANEAASRAHGDRPMALTPSTMLPLGSKAPAFRLPDTDGKPVALDDFK